MTGQVSKLQKGCSPDLLVDCGQDLGFLFNGKDQNGSEFESGWFHRGCGCVGLYWVLTHDADVFPTVDIV